MIGSTLRTDVDRILDSGVEGLRYFEVFLPRYQEWTGSAPAAGDYHALLARYDQQRGMDLERFRTFATVLGEELQERIIGQAQVQVARFAELPSRWSGSHAADSAEQFFSTVSLRAKADADGLSAIRAAASSVADELEGAVRRKADISRAEFAEDTVVGKSAEQIDWIIDCARGQARAPGSSIEEQTRALLPDYATAIAAETRCANWLNQVFVPEIDRKVDAFVALCEDSHTEVSNLYSELIAALDSLDPSSRISPGGKASYDSDLSYVVSQSQYPSAITPVSKLTSQDFETTSPTDEQTAQTAPVSLQESSLLLGSSGDIGQSDTTDETSAVPQQTAPTTLTSPKSGLSLDTTPGTHDVSDDSTVLVDEDLGGEDIMVAPDVPTADLGTGAAGVWTPSDIANLVTAVSHITGSIPDMITAVGTLAGSVDEIITAAGDATASVVDAVDNQPSAPERSTSDVDTGLEDSPDDGADLLDTEDMALSHEESEQSGEQSQLNDSPTQDPVRDTETPETLTAGYTPSGPSGPAMPTVSVTPQPKTNNPPRPTALTYSSPGGASI